MAVLINFKICDNSEECGGIVVCGSGALSWDDKNKTIKINNTKCTSCGACEPACEVHAIKVAKDKKEYAKLKKEIDDDPRKISDLFLDRYGAQPIIPSFSINEDQFNSRVLKASKIVAVEIYTDDTVQCMLKSIPITKLLNGIDIVYQKMKLCSDTIRKKYQVKKLPAMLFFQNGQLIGKIEGYYTLDNFDKLKSKIPLIIKKAL